MITLSVSNLTRKYNRKTVLDGVNFDHSSGVLGISGANGSGKSTLIKCLAGLLRPNSGTITWKRGDHTLTTNELKGFIGFAAPYISLYEELSVLENLKFLADVSHQDVDEIFYKELLSDNEISSISGKLYKSLSTGQQQRVKLASSLIKQPEVLFWDEPGSNLDEKGRTLVKQIIDNQKERGTLIILASNDPNELELCEDVLELSY
jgi:ABC-type multidrug transport system ATPase subunit